MKIDLTELRSEYESVYLAYHHNNPNHMEFEEWLEKVKGIKLKKNEKN